ncbi:YkgJ family cysteine cluster protein [bacterium]|nr:YkgJ family cysteine cluster protein [bacterium]
MRRSVSVKDISSFAKLNMIYNQVRVIEAKQNATQYKCLGSGNCCKIGLNIHMAECANIAFNIRQQYYLYLEDKGLEYADNWIDGIVKDLKEAMFDEDWQIGGETKRHCAFYKGGCSIYGYRPMVCRTFGTVTYVDDYCPRIRNAMGNIDYFSGDGVKKVIIAFQEFLKEYVSDKEEGYDMVVYMPLGVLSFLLTTEELIELEKTTDKKFWKAVQGWFNYRVGYTKLHGYGYDKLDSEAKAVGVELRFPKEE